MFSYLFTFIFLLFLAGIGIRIVFIVLDKLPKEAGYDLAALIIIFLTLCLLITIIKPNFFKIHSGGEEGGMYEEGLIEMIS